MSGKGAYCPAWLMTPLASAAGLARSDLSGSQAANGMGVGIYRSLGGTLALAGEPTDWGQGSPECGRYGYPVPPPNVSGKIIMLSCSDGVWNAPGLRPTRPADDSAVGA